MLPFQMSALIVVEQIFYVPGLGENFLMATTMGDIHALEAVLVLAMPLALLGWCVMPLLPELHATQRGILWDFPHLLRTNRLLLIGISMALLYLIVGLLAPWLSPLDPMGLGGMRDENPSMDHIFGTERIGRDILSRVIESTRTSLTFTSLVLLCGFLPGAILGLVLRAIKTHRFHPLMRRVAQGAAESAGMFLALPLLPAPLLFFYAFGFEVSSAVASLGIFAFMLGLRAALSPLPDGALTSVLGTAAVVGAAAIALQSTLSFLELYPSYDLTWGRDMSSARGSVPYHLPSYWFPAAAITIFTAGFLLIRTSLDDLDPPRPYER